MIKRTEGISPARPFEGKHAGLSEKIIKVFFHVYSELGHGFSERIYQKSLGIALREAGLEVEEQFPIKVHFHGQPVGDYFADMLVNQVIILELKTGDTILSEHEAQLLNYLKATEIEVGYVVNFGKSASFKRKIFDNDRKGSLRWKRR